MLSARRLCPPRQMARRAGENPLPYERTTLRRDELMEVARVVWRAGAEGQLHGHGRSCGRCTRWFPAVWRRSATCRTATATATRWWCWGRGKARTCRRAATTGCGPAAETVSVHIYSPPLGKIADAGPGRRDGAAGGGPAQPADLAGGGRGADRGLGEARGRAPTGKGRCVCRRGHWRNSAAAASWPPRCRRHWADGASLSSGRGSSAPCRPPCPIDGAGAGHAPGERRDDPHPGVAGHPSQRAALHEGQRWIASQARRGRILAVANSEPGAGGDLANTKTRAERGPDGVYRLTGRKSFATFGCDADYFLCAARRPDGEEGRSVVDGFFVARHAPGLVVDEAGIRRECGRRRALA